MILKTFENFSNDKYREAVKNAETLLTNIGHYKDPDGFWHVGEALEIRKHWVVDGRLVIKFAEVRGTFDAEGCNLTTLAGFPKVIKGNLSIIGNKITDFKESPITILTGILYASNNDLTSLVGAPRTVKNFYYHRNENLTNLEGAPSLTDAVTGNNNDQTKVQEVEALAYRSEFGKDWSNRSMSLLKYLVDKVKKEIITEEEFKDYIDALWWPEGFISDNLIKSVKAVDKFNIL